MEFTWSSLYSSRESVKNERSIGNLPKILDGKFFIYSEKESTSTKRVAICTSCLPKEVKICGFNNYTSNFVTHLKRRHGQEKFKEYQSYLKSEKKVPSTHHLERDSLNENTRSVLLSQEKFNENILNFFINSMLPLQVIEDPFFMKMFQCFDMSGKLNIVSGNTLKRLIDDRYLKDVTNIKDELSGIEQVCTNAHIWSSKTPHFLSWSSKTPRFLVVTAHWLDLNLQRKSKTLACRKFPNTYKYDQVAILLEEVHSEFGLDYQKVLTAVNDRGSHFVNAFKEFGVDIGSGFGNNFDATEGSHIIYIVNEVDPLHLANQSTIEFPEHLKCPAYKLNLCASDAIKVLKNETDVAKIHNRVIKKCNELWNIAINPTSAEIIRSIIGHSISKPESTQWSSLYDALQEIASIQKKSGQLYTSLGITKVWNAVDFEYINEYLHCFKPIAQALDILQGEQDMYYGILLPCLVSLRKKLQKLNQESFIFCKDLAKSYLESVERRFAEYFNITSKVAENAVVAAMSYPRFKDKWISCVEIKHHSRIRSIFEGAVVEVIVEDYKRLKVTPNNIDDSYFELDKSETESKGNMQISKAEDIISRYLADQDRNVFMLVGHPEIRRVFKKYNYLLPSTGPVERLFSNATMANIPESHKLLDEMFEKRLLLKSNLN